MLHHHPVRVAERRTRKSVLQKLAHGQVVPVSCNADHYECRRSVSLLTLVDSKPNTVRLIQDSHYPIAPEILTEYSRLESVRELGGAIERRVEILMPCNDLRRGLLKQACQG